MIEYLDIEPPTDEELDQILTLGELKKNQNIILGNSNNQRKGA